MQVLLLPLGVTASEPWLSDWGTRCWCRRICTYLALLFIGAEKCWYYFNQHGQQQHFHVFVHSLFAFMEVCSGIFVEGELLFLGLIEQGHDLHHFAAEIVVSAMEGGLCSELSKEEASL